MIPVRTRTFIQLAGACLSPRRCCYCRTCCCAWHYFRRFNPLLPPLYPPLLPPLLPLVAPRIAA